MNIRLLGLALAIAGLAGGFGIWVLAAVGRKVWGALRASSAL